VLERLLAEADRRGIAHESLDLPILRFEFGIPESADLARVEEIERRFEEFDPDGTIEAKRMVLLRNLARTAFEADVAAGGSRRQWVSAAHVLRRARVLGAWHLEKIPPPIERRLLSVSGYGAVGALGLGLVIALGRYEEQVKALLQPHLERLGLATYAGCFLLAIVVIYFWPGRPTFLRRCIDRIRGREPYSRSVEKGALPLRSRSDESLAHWTGQRVPDRQENAKGKAKRSTRRCIDRTKRGTRNEE
jgi:hypothetical protein